MIEWQRGSRQIDRMIAVQGIAGDHAVVCLWDAYSLNQSAEESVLWQTTRVPHIVQRKIKTAIT